MVTLSPGKPFSTTEPKVVVENALPIGLHLFQLVVVDDSGNVSAPVELAVSVQKQVPRPTPETPPTRQPDPTSLRGSQTINPAALRTLNPRNIQPK